MGIGDWPNKIRLFMPQSDNAHASVRRYQLMEEFSRWQLFFPLRDQHGMLTNLVRAFGCS